MEPNKKIVIAKKLQVVRAKRDKLETEKQGYLSKGMLDDAQVNQMLIMRCEREMLNLHVEYNLVEA